MSGRDWQRHRWKLTYAERDEWSDLHPQARRWADERLAGKVQSALSHFAGERYDPGAYVFMPSHFHWLFRPRLEWVTSLGELAQVRTPRERITPSTQRLTTLACHRLRNRSSQFGAAGSDGQIVQGDDELIRILADIELNPVQRGWVVCREEWRFSFGQDRSFLSPDQVSQPLTNNLLAMVRASEAHPSSDRFPTCRKKPRRSCQRAEERRAVGGGGRPTGSKTCRTVFAALPGGLPWQTAGPVPGKI
jgi:hypothetical protein